MDLRNLTKNQHFLSQVEQRFNAVNSQARSNNQRIYSFSISDRNSHTINIDSGKGIKVSKNQSLHDLFSFHVLEKETGRYNFEKLFEDYENKVKINTESLLAKIYIPGADVKSEIIDIFRFKILNFVRNPYSIEKILNTFSAFKDVFPTEPIHYKNFNLVLNGNKPQKNKICKQLGITENYYREWLATIFLLLTPLGEGHLNFLDNLIKRMYENPNSLIKVIVYNYDKESCLLSDRGFSFYELENNTTVWDFNLYSHGFIRYIFIDIEALAPQDTPKEMLDMLRSTSNKVGWMREHNDFAELEIYNQRTIELCHEHVFGASKEYKGVTVSL